MPLRIDPMHAGRGHGSTICHRLAARVFSRNFQRIAFPPTEHRNPVDRLEPIASTEKPLDRTDRYGTISRRMLYLPLPDRRLPIAQWTHKPRIRIP